MRSNPAQHGKANLVKSCHISSAVVLAEGRRQAELVVEMAAITGVTVAAAEGGKIVVVIEGADRRHVADCLTAIGSMPGVFAANMVFEYAENEEESDDRSHAS